VTTLSRCRAVSLDDDKVLARILSTPTSIAVPRTATPATAQSVFFIDRFILVSRSFPVPQFIFGSNRVPLNGPFSQPRSYVARIARATPRDDTTVAAAAVRVPYDRLCAESELQRTENRTCRAWMRRREIRRERQAARGVYASIHHYRGDRVPKSRIATGGPSHRRDRGGFVRHTHFAARLRSATVDPVRTNRCATARGLCASRSHRHRANPALAGQKRKRQDRAQYLPHRTRGYSRRGQHATSETGAMGGLNGLAISSSGRAILRRTSIKRTNRL
jgi:hypothetical protein